MAKYRRSNPRGVMAMGVMAGLGLLAACREDREVVFYEPHVYLGPSEPGLSQDTIAELADRAKQGGRL